MATFDYDEFYSPWAQARRRAAASPDNPATTGVPNPGRSDPYPRFDPDAATRRAAGAIAYGEAYGSEPRTAAELEEASGVDRRIPDAPNTFGPVRRGAAGSRIVEGTGGAYGYTNGSVDGLYPYGTRTEPPPTLEEGLLSSGRGGVTPAQAAAMTRNRLYVGNPNDHYFERTYGTAAAEKLIGEGRLDVPTLMQAAARRGEDVPAAELRAQEDRIAKAAMASLAQTRGDASKSVFARNAAGAELSRLEEERRRRDALDADAARMAAQLRMAEIANRPGPVSFGGGAGAMPNADGGWDYQTPPQAAPAAPAPVSFGDGAGAIPDGNGGYTYQGPPPAPADPNAGPWAPNGGLSAINRVTGEIKTAQMSPPVQTGRFKFEENGITDTATGTRIELPPRDRKVVLQEMIDRATQQIVAKGDDLYGSGAKQIEILKAELRALSGEPDPTPAETQEARRKPWWKRIFGAEEEEQAVPAPAEPAPAEPAPQPAAPAEPATQPAAPAKPAAAEPEPKPAPPGFRRMPNGELEYVG